MIVSKSQMYKLLAAGEFGNTIPQYFSVEEWLASGDDKRFPTWGVRTLRAGGPCRFNCPSDEVEATVLSKEFSGDSVNISCMVDKVANVTLWADVWDSPTGIIVYGIEYPCLHKDWTWRNSMPTRGRHWHGIAAKMLLQKHLNPNSLADVYEVFERYPGHVAEMSTLDRCFGTVPHSNHIIWELRHGTYGY